MFNSLIYHLHLGTMLILRITTIIVLWFISKLSTATPLSVPPYISKKTTKRVFPFQIESNNWVSGLCYAKVSTGREIVLQTWSPQQPMFTISTTFEDEEKLTVGLECTDMHVSPPEGFEISRESNPTPIRAFQVRPQVRCGENDDRTSIAHEDCHELIEDLMSSYNTSLTRCDSDLERCRVHSASSAIALAEKSLRLEHQSIQLEECLQNAIESRETTTKCIEQLGARAQELESVKTELDTCSLEGSREHAACLTQLRHYEASHLEKESVHHKDLRSLDGERQANQLLHSQIAACEKSVQELDLSARNCAQERDAALRESLERTEENDRKYAALEIASTEAAAQAKKCADERADVSARAERCETQRDASLKHVNECDAARASLLEQYDACQRDKDAHSTAAAATETLYLSRVHALTAREASLGVKTQLLQDMESSLRTHALRLAEQREQFAVDAALMSEQAEALKERQSRVLRHEEAIQQQKHNLQLSSENVRVLGKALRAREQDLVRLELEMERHRDDVQKREDEAEKREKNLKKLRVAVEDDEKAVKHREQGLRQNEKILNQRESILRELDKTLQMREEALKQQKEAISQREEQLQRREHEVEAKLKQITMISSVNVTPTAPQSSEQQKDAVSKLSTVLSELGARSSETMARYAELAALLQACVSREAARDERAQELSVGERVMDGENTAKFGRVLVAQIMGELNVVKKHLHAHAHAHAHAHTHLHVYHSATTSQKTLGNQPSTLPYAPQPPSHTSLMDSHHTRVISSNGAANQALDYDTRWQPSTRGGMFAMFNFFSRKKSFTGQLQHASHQDGEATLNAKTTESKTDSTAAEEQQSDDLDTDPGLEILNDWAQSVNINTLLALEPLFDIFTYENQHDADANAYDDTEAAATDALNILDRYDYIVEYVASERARARTATRDTKARVTEEDVTAAAAAVLAASRWVARVDAAGVWALAQRATELGAWADAGSLHECPRIIVSTIAAQTDAGVFHALPSEAEAVALVTAMIQEPAAAALADVARESVRVRNELLMARRAEASIRTPESSKERMRPRQKWLLAVLLSLCALGQVWACVSASFTHERKIASVATVWAAVTATVRRSWLHAAARRSGIVVVKNQDSSKDDVKDASSNVKAVQGNDNQMSETTSSPQHPLAQPSPHPLTQPSLQPSLHATGRLYGRGPTGLPLGVSSPITRPWQRTSKRSPVVAIEDTKLESREDGVETHTKE